LPIANLIVLAEKIHYCDGRDCQREMRQHYLQVVSFLRNDRVFQAKLLHFLKGGVETFTKVFIRCISIAIEGANKFGISGKASIKNVVNANVSGQLPGAQNLNAIIEN